MGYKLTYKEIILEGYRDRLTFNQITCADVIYQNYLANINNGNILDSGSTIDPNDPYVRDCWCIYKDQATAKLLFEENSKAVPDIARSLEGFYAYDVNWADV